MEQRMNQARLQSLVHQEPRNKSPALRFDHDGTFQITVFSDLHYAEDEPHDSINDRRTAEVVTNVLSAEHTQLVVLNGDLISGGSMESKNASYYLDKIVAPIREKKLPWASTYGNHDYWYRFHSDAIFKAEGKYKNSLTQNMAPQKSCDTGVTNYYLPVYASSNAQEGPVLILWFFDSKGGYWSDGSHRKDWVDKSVVDWFNKTNANLQKQYGSVPSLAFFHIPMNSTLAFQEEGVDPSKEPGVNKERVTSQGQQYTNPPCYDCDKQFMQALLNTQGLLATFSGHDHENDWCFKWNDSISNTTLAGNGLNVCYGRHTGYGGYGHLTRGGRQILLNQSKLDEVRTWIRLENGLVTENVTLNSTFGQDEYHPLPHMSVKDVSQGRNLDIQIYPTILSMFLVVYLSLRLWNA